MTASPEGGLPAAMRLLLLLLLPFLFYFPSIGGEWVYDDHPAIEANRGLDDLGARAGEALLGRRTLTDFTFALNRSAGGLDPLGYRLGNVALHGANAGLLFLLGLGLFRRLGGEDRPLAAAWGAALLFAAHPLLSQAVAYTAQRYTSLATFFYLLACVLYLRARERSSLRAGLFAFIAAYLAMRSKEIAFTLPFAILFLEAYLFRGRERRLRFALPFLVLLPLIPLALLLGTEGVGRTLPAERLAAFREAPDLSRDSYLATEFGVILRYLRLLFWPSGLTADHDVAIVAGLGDSRALLPLAGILALLAGAWAVRRRFPALLFGLVWFLLTLAVESSIVPIRDVMMEHRAYLPSVGIFLAAGAALARAGRRSGVLLAALVLLLGVLTFERSRTWARSIDLWEDAARQAPRLVRPDVNLGLAYRAAGRNAEAAACYEKALRKDPSLVEAWYGLGVALGAMGRDVEALEAFERAREIAPDYGPAYDGAADLLAATGLGAEADSLLRLGLERAGEDPFRCVRMADLLLAQGKPREAGELYRYVLESWYDCEPAVLGYARALHAMGQTERAEQDLLTEAEHFRSPHIWNGIGVLRLSMGRGEEAAEAFRRALRIDPNHPEARANLERMERRGGSR
ncbi:MAG: tetratricopeptide repeat protein [Candidatus Eisenbacteria bacterium]